MVSWVAPAVIAILPVRSGVAEPTIRCTPGDRPQVEVHGLAADSLSALAATKYDRATRTRVLSLYVEGGDRLSAATPVLGECSVQDNRLVFKPQFPLRPGIAYRAVLDLRAVPAEQKQQGRVEAVFNIPPSDHQQTLPPVVTTVFPTNDVLPENQLKFYLHFSAPMRQGEVYRYIRLLNQAGKPVELPFLELAEELWDESGTRLTLLLDPGRVKRDLRPHKELGRALVDGGEYTLVIAKEWPAAQGAPLSNNCYKRFRVTKADVRQPNPQRWRLTAPKAQTRDRFELAFDEPLDHALLQHSIRVVGPAGNAVEGRVAVSQHEMRWHFVPDEAWQAGRYRLHIDATLEDLAGNSIGRPFEVYLPDGQPADLEHSELSFVIDDRPTATQTE